MEEREERNGLRNNAELDATPLDSVSSMSTASKKRVSQEVSHSEEGAPTTKKSKMAENAAPVEVRDSQIWFVQFGLVGLCMAVLSLSHTSSFVLDVYLCVYQVEISQGSLLTINLC